MLITKDGTKVYKLDGRKPSILEFYRDSFFDDSPKERSHIAAAVLGDRIIVATICKDEDSLASSLCVRVNNLHYLERECMTRSYDEEDENDPYFNYDYELSWSDLWKIYRKEIPFNINDDEDSEEEAGYDWISLHSGLVDEQSKRTVTSHECNCLCLPRKM